MRNKKRGVLADMYAHRGFHCEGAPENSMAAFRRSVGYGMPTEIDVHLIADGSLVVFHDDDLKRMTGAPGRIADYDITNLGRLRLAGTDEHVPTFDEVLDLFEDSGLPLLIELKVDRRNHRELARAAASKLASYGGEFAVQSFYPRAVMEFRRLMPDVAVGQLSKSYFNAGDGSVKMRAAMAGSLLFNIIAKPDFVAYKFKDRRNRALERAIDKGGMAKAAWTIRTPRAYRAAVEAGCIPIFEGFDPRTDKGGLR